MSISLLWRVQKDDTTVCVCEGRISTCTVSSLDIPSPPAPPTLDASFEASNSRTKCFRDFFFLDWNPCCQNPLDISLNSVAMTDYNPMWRVFWQYKVLQQTWLWSFHDNKIAQHRNSCSDDILTHELLSVSKQCQNACAFHWAEFCCCGSKLCFLLFEEIAYACIIFQSYSFWYVFLSRMLELVSRNQLRIEFLVVNYLGCLEIITWSISLHMISSASPAYNFCITQVFVCIKSLNEVKV